MRILVIGGGAAGFFCAVNLAARLPAARITILERGKSVLEKVRISGGGRCNVTHACWEPRELVKFYPRGGRELLGPFHKFACGDTMAWFGDRGVALKIEEDGRVFPESDTSQTIIDCLWGEGRHRGVDVVTGARVEQISASSNEWVVQVGNGTYRADRLVVTTGSNPGVWKMLEKLGHAIVAPVPSLFALNIKDARLAGLAGISLPWVQLSAAGNQLRVEGPLLITHKGLSGPAVLRLSAWGARQLHPLGYDFELSVNWVARRGEDISQELTTIRTKEARKQIGKHARCSLPLRLWQSLLNAAGVPPDQQWAQLSNEQLLRLIAELTDGRYQVTGKATNKEEFTTAGGVDLREVDFRTFQSRVRPGLYLAGEVLDVDAITGGFNFQAAWTGGAIIADRLE